MPFIWLAVIVFIRLGVIDIDADGDARMSCRWGIGSTGTRGTIERFRNELLAKELGKA